MLVAHLVYIYLDFSAYSDMAIGSARAMGYKVPENFKWPLLRESLSKYWQSWHITLSSWVRRNVFMNVLLASRSIFLATFCTMMAIGLWHKLALGWLLWAVHHSSFLYLEHRVGLLAKRSYNSWLSKRPITDFCQRAVRISYVWFLVAAGQSFIMFSDIHLALQAYASMYGVFVESVEILLGVKA